MIVQCLPDKSKALQRTNTLLVKAVELLGELIG